jgi:hypothetical protein
VGAQQGRQRAAERGIVVDDTYDRAITPDSHEW